MGGGASQELQGVRVFRVHPGSPAKEAGLEVFFDLILEVNGVAMDSSDQQAFAQKMQEAENGCAKMKVYNCRAQNTRDVMVMPRKWAGTGILGATVRYDSVDPAETHGIRVLEVFPNSPAAHAGLVPFQDFMLGTGSIVFNDIDDLVDVVGAALGKEILVYTYNTDSETVREVALTPNYNWGGEGCLGCDTGTGLLHKIPVPRRPLGGVPVANGGPTTAAGMAAQAAAAAPAVPLVPAAPPPLAAATPVAVPPPRPPPGTLPTPVYPPGVAPPVAPPAAAAPATTPGAPPAAPAAVATPAAPPAPAPAPADVVPPPVPAVVPPAESPAAPASATPVADVPAAPPSPQRPSQVGKINASWPPAPKSPAVDEDGKPAAAEAPAEAAVAPTEAPVI